MGPFIWIVLNIIVPVFVLIGIGAAMRRKLTIDLKTLSELNLYLFVPGIIFVKLYEARFPMTILGQAIGFLFVLSAVLYLCSALVSRLLRHDKKMKIAFSNSAMFYNAGNYGVPVNELVFRGDPLAMGIQIIVLTFQNIFTFSYGVIILQSMQQSRLRLLLKFLGSPVFLAMAAGVVCQLTQVKLPEAIMVPAHYVADGLVAVALVTLGAQVAELPVRKPRASVLANVLIRLVLGPALAFGLIGLFQLDGTLAYALLVASAMPTAVNSSIIAQVYGNEPEFSAETVLVSTLASAFTVTIIIYAGQLLYSLP